ncbi:MAG: lysophospholipid acyltransferase family protein [Planctomycetota bacterium]|nr:lysophospholipid acyltransferase family protein [Planctomycetota bacterium]MDA1214803.1 lysophospholipid acyltransferase family protein [Planctomycetota bacterium]
MNDFGAISILVIFFVVAVVVVLFQACRCPSGWNVWWIYALERVYVPFMFRWRSNRRCPFPDEGPAIILANHRSPVDPLLIWMQHHLSGPTGRIRRLSFLTAREYCELPGLIGWMCRNLHSIPVDRNGRDMGPVREALRRLKAGHLIGVFPEGGINKGEGLREANPGVAWLALHSQAPVYPIYIQGAPQTQSMVEPFYTFSHVRVVYGDPIDLSPYYGKKKTPELLQEVTDLMMRRLGELNER